MRRCVTGTNENHGPIDELRGRTGITFAGVGNGTTVNHIEVAFNEDDGVEFFGGKFGVAALYVVMPR